MNHTMRTHKNERGGVVLGFMAIALLVFMGLAVVAIDFGHLGLSANEVQIVADTAATAGARSLLKNKQNGAGENPVAVAQTVVAQNHVDDGGASIAASDVEIGTFDFTTRSFSNGGANPNAVRATGRATVNNMVAGFFGDRTSDVTRDAIAAYSGNGSGMPPCPIAVGVCHFNKYKASGTCSDLPKLSQAPSTADNSGWTSLFDGSANAMTFINYLPAACGGGGQTAPNVHVGQDINLSNGQVNSALKTLEDCFKAGLLTECLVPIVKKDCNENFNGTSEVLGFATFKITKVKSTGNPKYISMDGICETDAPGAAGGGDYGTFTVSMVD